jgi:hypothetical protein
MAKKNLMRAASILMGSVLLLSSGCATYIHPERAAVPVNQRGPVDGLMIFFNIISTAGLGLIVDFAHGTIYLPKWDYTGPGGNAESRPEPPRPDPVEKKSR